jgi:hypothetical protein
MWSLMPATLKFFVHIFRSLVHRITSQVKSFPTPNHVLDLPSNPRKCCQSLSDYTPNWFLWGNPSPL